MDLKSKEERWAVWMVQARNFAKRQNYTDAVARMKLVRDAVRASLDDGGDPKVQERLEGLLARTEEELGVMSAQYEAWRSEIAARRQHTIDQAAEEMARPLPVPAAD
jgi:hypothetical protein